LAADSRQSRHVLAMSLSWTLCIAALRFFSADAQPLAYPEGVKPGDQISGNQGEFWRYKHVLLKPPDDTDRMEALKMGEDIKCTTCETILHRLMKRVESISEDHIMDALDGEPDEIPELTGDDQADRVSSHKRGCNKHFKDEVLERGFLVEKCPAVSVTIDTGDDADKDRPKHKEWCLRNAGSEKVGRGVDTYSTRSEAAFYACENTIARHGAEIASYLADKLDGEGSTSLAGAVKDACRKAARCDGAAGRKDKKRRKASGEKQVKKKTKKADDEEASMWDIMKEQKELEKKNKKRRRKSAKLIEHEQKELEKNSKKSTKRAEL